MTDSNYSGGRRHQYQNADFDSDDVVSVPFVPDTYTITYMFNLMYMNMGPYQYHNADLDGYEVEGDPFFAFNYDLYDDYSFYSPKIQLTIPSRVTIKETTNEDHQCVICYNNAQNIKFVPCGHTHTCSECYINLTENECPFCRQDIYEIGRYAPLYPALRKLLYKKKNDRMKSNSTNIKHPNKIRPKYMYPKHSNKRNKMNNQINNPRRYRH